MSKKNQNITNKPTTNDVTKQNGANKKTLPIIIGGVFVVIVLCVVLCIIKPWSTVDDNPSAPTEEETYKRDEGDIDLPEDIERFEEMCLVINNPFYHMKIERDSKYFMDTEDRLVLSDNGPTIQSNKGDTFVKEVSQDGSVYTLKFNNTVTVEDVFTITPEMYYPEDVSYSLNMGKRRVEIDGTDATRVSLSLDGFSAHFSEVMRECVYWYYDNRAHKSYVKIEVRLEDPGDVTFSFDGEKYLVETTSSFLGIYVTTLGYDTNNKKKEVWTYDIGCVGMNTCPLMIDNNGWAHMTATNPNFPTLPDVSENPLFPQLPTQPQLP